VANRLNGSRRPLFENSDLKIVRRPKEKPEQGSWGALGLGLLIFETKTHPVTDSLTLGSKLGCFGELVPSFA
jgi:hypothetical protein